MIQVMKRHLENQDIIAYACMALMKLAVNTKNQVTIAEADGIPVSVSMPLYTTAIRDHTWERGVVVPGRGVLEYLGERGWSTWERGVGVPGRGGKSAFSKSDSA